MIEDAVSKGAKIICGGKRGEKSTLFQPTLITNVKSNMEIAHTEIFGPVAAIRRYVVNFQFNFSIFFYLLFQIIITLLPYLFYSFLLFFIFLDSMVRKRFSKLLMIAVVDLPVSIDYSFNFRTLFLS